MSRAVPLDLPPSPLIEHLQRSLVAANLLLALSLTLLDATLVVLLIAMGHWRLTWECSLSIRLYQQHITRRYSWAHRRADCARWHAEYSMDMVS